MSCKKSVTGSRILISSFLGNFFIRSGWNSFCSDLDGIWFSIKSDFTN
ncbi:hypothetical protein LEP1GSC191_0520 [Leptospira borgpetersenii serovar Mini str. 201000851]|nr:hypothetical protein LEP1GSC191_0520 [Leptospira borgpetersenii serovar Mini str. 201000851]